MLPENCEISFFIKADDVTDMVHSFEADEKPASFVAKIQNLN